MQNARALWLVFGLTLLLCTSVACEQAGGDAVLGADLLAAEQEGITLGADPEQIVLDPNDPEAPRDPVTGKLIGKTSLGAFVRDADGEPQVGVEVTFSTTAGRLESEGQPVTTNERGLATDVLAVDEDDAGEVEITAVSGDFTQTLIVPVILVPLNTPPTADAGDDQTVECPTVTLDGSGSSDPDSTPGTNDDIVKFEWFVDEIKIADGEMVEVELPVGTTVVTLTVTDRAGATDSDDTTVMLQDTTPPMVTLRMNPNELWPPNHKLHDIEAVLDIRDCDPSPTIELLEVSSNEPDNGTGDGNTTGDIQGAGLGSSDTHFRLRAERSGGGSGRTYTVRYRVTDSEGLSSTATATVTVPHDQGH